MTIIGMVQALNSAPWASSALCAQSDPELWFDEKGAERKAKLVCQSCPVRRECLLLALEQREPFGVWGGKSPEERAAIRRGTPIRWERIKCCHGHDLGEVGLTIRGLCKACAAARTKRDVQRRQQLRQPSEAL
ncbi:Transcriptional regulator WhiB2 [Mycobacterium persicum]|uniref:Transcriptional regulator WhiB n=1 Tax=Mycobacterium persicum TaxID=1487726 RepID=A0ABY6RSI9_9MYCO|nr:WhiB family transcriptional regulator [Mycobacterium persicum]ORB93971.1 hypothetical protein B1T44_04870 [Mycobacterium persicum]VBA33037.1 Transcriptional regulator WhiB2 [Mycobacterium persicum]